MRVLFLADYFDINDIFNEISERILSGQIPINILLDNSELYQHIPIIKLAAATYIISKNNIFEQLPVWVQSIFVQYKTRLFPTVTTQPILLKFISQIETHNPPYMVDVLGQQYLRDCPAKYQPRIITPEIFPEFLLK
jgi:hypothetical protein